jgi:hypothetical protein
MLESLNVPTTIAHVEDRKTVQKAVYLGQVAGVDLGYRYNWYRMGPYSPGLTRDYFALAAALNSGNPEAASGYELRAPIRDRLARLQPILEAPGSVGLSRADWLELVASVHFLRTQRQMTAEQTLETLKREKPHVVSFLDEAVAALQNGGLLAG